MIFLKEAPCFIKLPASSKISAVTLEFLKFSVQITSPVKRHSTASFFIGLSEMLLMRSVVVFAIGWLLNKLIL